MAAKTLFVVLVVVASLSGLALAQSATTSAVTFTPATPSRPAQPTLPGRAWTQQKLGGQGNGDWGQAVVAPQGKWITTWSLGTGPINGVFGDDSFSLNGTLSLQGRLNDGTWLPKLNASSTVTQYYSLNQTRGFTAIWGRAGGWLTEILGAGSNDLRDDIWALNGANVNFNNTAKIVGYQLRTFSYIGDASFAFDSTI